MRQEVPPYSMLASGYDVIMDHVDYTGWVAYVDTLIREHGGVPGSVIELGCGTGTFALLFSELYHVPYVATDSSENMLDVATGKAKQHRGLLSFEPLDFFHIRHSGRFDLAILLYDGINYLTDPAEVAMLFRDVSDLLLPEGRFIFDVSTPFNSKNNATFFEDEGVCAAFSYVRKSRYSEDSGFHETVFELESEYGSFLERHIQRPYGFNEIRDILTKSPLEELAAYADFTLKQVDKSAERIHWVTKKRSQTV